MIEILLLICVGVVTVFGCANLVTIAEWFTVLTSGEPHLYIGGKQNPYLLRWYLIPRNRFFNIYLHKFLRDDDDRALHDHPWWFLSIMIWGGYMEEVYCKVTKTTDVKYRSAFSFVLRKPTHRHRVMLYRHPKDFSKPIPCWTIILTGPTVRTWGFWCPRGFVPHHEFVEQKDGSDAGYNNVIALIKPTRKPKKEKKQ